MISHVKFATLPVADQDRALCFYRDRLGLTVAEDRPYQDGLRWIELAVPGARTRLWFSEREGDAPADRPSLIFISPDVRAAFAELSAKGVAFVLPPAEAPWSPGETYALFRDTEGNMLMLGEDHG